MAGRWQDVGIELDIRVIVHIDGTTGEELTGNLDVTTSVLESHSRVSWSHLVNTHTFIEAQRPI